MTINVDHAAAIRKGLISTGYPSPAAIDAGLDSLAALLAELEAAKEALRQIANSVVATDDANRIARAALESTAA